MRRAWAAVLVALPALGAPLAQSRPASGGDPFAFLRPWVEVTPEDRARADRGEVVVRMLPASGQEVAVLAVAAMAAEPDAFAARIHDIESLKRSSRVPGIRRFSNPPARDDLAGFELDQDELGSLRRCRPGNCGLKLSTLEMAHLRQVADAAGPQWEPALQQAFRDLVFGRVARYLEGGLGTQPAYQDKDEPVRTADVFARLLERSPYLAARLPSLAYLLEHFPRAPLDGADTYLYWSRERFDGRAVASVTHVVMHRPDAVGLPLVVVAGKQLFATHYTRGALSLTCLTGGASRYLVYLNRSEVDVLGGFFGPVKRAILNGRVQRDAAAVLEGLRARLEAPDGSEPR